MPLTCCVLPVPEGPANMTGRCFLTKSVIQNATEQVSDVGTVMADMFIVARVVVDAEEVGALGLHGSSSSSSSSSFVFGV